MGNAEIVDLKAIGSRLKELRTGQKLTQGELGEMLGMKRSALANVEQGLAAPSVKTLILLKERFGIDIYRLLTGKSGTEEIPKTEEDVINLLLHYMKTFDKFREYVIADFIHRWKPLLDSDLIESVKTTPNED